MRHLRSAYWVCCLLLFPALVAKQQACAAVTLQVSIDAHNEPGKTDSKIPGDWRESLEVVLADGYIVVKSSKGATRFDFKNRRRVVFDADTKSYVTYSLYDTVGFRTLEFRNREVLHQMIAAAKIPEIAWSAADNEHLLSVHSRSPAQIGAAVIGDDMVFSGGGKQLARWSNNGFEVGVPDAERFAMFLRYWQGGHPGVLSRLAAGTVIPKKLSYTFTEVWGTSRRSISVDAVREGDAGSNDLNSYSMRKAGASSDPLDDLLDQASGLTAEAMDVAKARNREGVENAFRDRQALDAMLGTLEWSLMTGQPMPPLSPGQSSWLRDDQSVRRFLSTMGANTKEQVAEAAKILMDLRSQAPGKAYVLKIFEANNRARMGDPLAARKLFIDVLQNNSLIAGAYKDLGDVLLAQFDSPRAWRCWDVGRRLAPQFTNFAVVNEFEKSLAAKHPEYF